MDKLIFKVIIKEIHVQEPAPAPIKVIHRIPNHVFEQKEKEISQELLKRSTSTSFAASSMSNPTPTTTATTSISRSVLSSQNKLQSRNIYAQSPGAKFANGTPKMITAKFSGSSNPSNGVTSSPKFRYQQQEADVTATKSPVMQRILSRNNQPMSANLKDVPIDIYGDYEQNNGYGTYMAAQPSNNYSNSPIYAQREAIAAKQQCYFEDRKRRSNEFLNAASIPHPPASQPLLRKPIPQNLCNGQYDEQAISRYSKNISDNYVLPATKPAAYPNGKFIFINFRRFRPYYY
jgi:hypothetical protein